MIKVYKNKNIVEPINELMYVPGHFRTAFRSIKNISIVDTINGKMMRCQIDVCDNLSTPDLDIIMLVGQVQHVSNTALGDRLWFYKDKYWMNARFWNGLEYYKDKLHILYEVTVTSNIMELDIINNLK